MSDPPVAGPAERIAAAVERLRARQVRVNETVYPRTRRRKVPRPIDATATRYEATRPAYHVLVYVDLPRHLGLEFDLLGADGSVRLHYFIDTGRHDISQPRHVWYAAATATDIVLFLDALADGGLLARIDRRRASIIVPTGAGPRIVRRGRIWTTAGRHHGNVDAALNDGYHRVPR